MDRNIVNRCLTLFASEPALLGGDITETMVQTFSEEVQTLEARCMYGYMMQARNIYQELFALCLQEFSRDHEERKQFFIDARDNSRFFKERANCKKVPSLKRTAEWVKKYALDEERSFADRNVALACWHHVHNSTVFALLFHLHNSPAQLEKRGLPKMKKDGHQVPRALSGLVHGLEKVNADLLRYFQYDELINAHLLARPSEETAREIVTSAVEIETAMIKELFQVLSTGEPLTLAGELIPNVDVLVKYCESRGDEVLSMFGHGPSFDVENPLQWIDDTVAEHDSDAKPSSKNGTPSKSPMVKSPMSATPKTPGTMQSGARENFTLDADF